MQRTESAVGLHRHRDGCPGHKGPGRFLGPLLLPTCFEVAFVLHRPRVKTVWSLETGHQSMLFDHIPFDKAVVQDGRRV